MRISDWSSDVCSSDLKSWRSLLRESSSCELAVADADFLKAFRAPDIPVHANSPEVEGRHAERFRPYFAVPAIEAPKEEIGIPVGQSPRLDWAHIVDEKEKHVAVARIERRRVLCDLNKRIVPHRRPIEHARHFPARVARSIARDLHDRRHQLMVPDAPIIRAGDGTQFGA